MNGFVCPIVNLLIFNILASTIFRNISPVCPFSYRSNHLCLFCVIKNGFVTASFGIFTAIETLMGWDSHNCHSGNILPYHPISSRSFLFRNVDVQGLTGNILLNFFAENNANTFRLIGNITTTTGLIIGQGTHL